MIIVLPEQFAAVANEVFPYRPALQALQAVVLLAYWPIQSVNKCKNEVVKRDKQERVATTLRVHHMIFLVGWLTHLIDTTYNLSTQLYSSMTLQHTLYNPTRNPTKRYLIKNTHTRFHTHTHTHSEMIRKQTCKHIFQWSMTVVFCVSLFYKKHTSLRTWRRRFNGQKLEKGDKHDQTNDMLAKITWEKRGSYQLHIQTNTMKTQIHTLTTQWKSNNKRIEGKQTARDRWFVSKRSSVFSTLPATPSTNSDNRSRTYYAVIRYVNIKATSFIIEKLATKKTSN